MAVVTDYTVEVRDREFTRVGQIAPEFLDLKFVEVFRSVGAWEMKLPAEHPLLPALKQKGAGIIITERGAGATRVYSGRMRSAVLSQDAADPKGTWLISGVDDNVIAAATTVLPDPTHTPDVQEAGYWNASGPGETVMKNVVKLNAGSLAIPSRAYPWLTVAPDQGRGGLVSASARFDTLGDLLASLGVAAGLGWRFAQVGDGVTFEVFQTTDRSASVRLDIRNGGVASTELGYSAPAATSALVLGQGQGEERTVHVVTSPEAEAEAALWGLRWEVTKDQRNTDDPVELQQAGEEILTESGATVHSLKVVPSDAPNQRLGVDWGLGDKVGVVVDGAPAVAVVTEVATSISAAGVIRQATVGDPIGFDWEARISATVKKQDARIGALERLVDTGTAPGRYLDDFYEAADDGDWAKTLTRAFASTNPGEAIYLGRVYPYRSVAIPVSNRLLIGSGDDTGFAWDRDAGHVPTSLFNVQGISDLTLDNFRVDGGVRPGDPDISSGARTIQFRDGARLTLTRLHVSGSPDWAVAFVRCTFVTVRDHRHSGGGMGFPGGRDGLHFLDCSDFLVDGARMDTGDDCVGITTETVGTARGVVRNVHGRSDIGSLVICNEEGSTTFPANNLVIENIHAYDTARNIVRIRAYNAATVVHTITIRGITGRSTTNAAIEIYGTPANPLTGLSLSDIAVFGQSNGIQAARLRDFSLKNIVVRGTVGATGDGVQLSYCDVGIVDASAMKCSRWGFNLNFCTNVIVRGVASECGAAQFANNTGGGLTVTNSSTIRISGIYRGDPSTSYRGIFGSGITDVVVDPDTVRVAANP